MTNRDKLVTVFGSENIENLIGTDEETFRNWLACQYQPISNSLEFIIGGKYFFKCKEEAIRISGKAKQEGFSVEYITNSEFDNNMRENITYGFEIIDPYKPNIDILNTL